MTKEIRIGLLAIISIALLIWGYKFLLGTNILDRSNTFYIEYDNIDNLQISDPVFIRGFKVGTVKNIYIKPEDYSKLIVVLDVDRKVNLPQNTIAELQNVGMMGGKAINLKYTGDCQGDCVKSGEYLQGVLLGFIQSLVQPSEIDVYMESIKSGIGGVMDSLTQSIEDNPEGAVSKTLADLSIAVANLKNSTILMNQLFAASSSKLTGTLSNLESVTATFKANNDQISGLLKNANEITRQLSSAHLDTTILKTNRALGSTNDAISSLQGTLEKADLTFTELQSLLTKINAGEGTMGKLMSDKEMYDNLTRATKNLDLLLQDFRIHPKRYVNVSVFGKKEKSYVLPDEDPAFPNDTIKN
jgi:phospholipid/cholesterol/gamma-HCH transport system substrate-binding protein